MASPFPSCVETVSEYQECRTHRGSELQMNVGGCRKFSAKSSVSLFGFGKTTTTDVCANCDCPRSNHVKREGGGCCYCRHNNIHCEMEAAAAAVKYKTEVVYTKCQKIHEKGSHLTVDGCQEFMESDDYNSSKDECAACRCHKSFHRNEIATPI